MRTNWCFVWRALRQQLATPPRRRHASNRNTQCHPKDTVSSVAITHIRYAIRQLSLLSIRIKFIDSKTKWPSEATATERGKMCHRRGKSIFVSFQFQFGICVINAYALFVCKFISAFDDLFLLYWWEQRKFHKSNYEMAGFLLHIFARSLLFIPFLAWSVTNSVC